MAKSRILEIRWPTLGVQRINAHERVYSAPSYPAQWAVNVRNNDPFDRRRRGGSRPGLTKFVSDDMGTTIADIASINVSSASGGASEVLFVLVDSAIKTVEDDTTTTQVAYLTNESGDILTNEGGDRLVVSSGSAPSSGFLLTGQQHVYAVTTSAIVKMDPKTGQVDNVLASSGTIPTNCTFGAIYRDRMYLSGEDNAIYASRLGDYTDWNFGKDVGDLNRAVVFQLSMMADVGPLPTALIPHKDQHMLAASARTLWVVGNEPTTGELRRISENIGIIDKRAWAKIEDLICFVSEDGVYRVNADGSGLQPLSEEAVPAELLDIDTSTTTVTMGWEQDRMAVHIYLRTSGGSDTHWIYEMDGSGAFWPMRLPDDHSPLATCQHNGKLLLAGNDGYIRYVAGDDDDGTTIKSHILLGPFRVGGVNMNGLIRTIHGIMAAGSGTVTWRLIGGETAEEVCDNGKLAIEASLAGNDFDEYYDSYGAWDAGRSKPAWPRQRCAWLCVWLSSTSKWAFESVNMDIVPEFGRIR